MAEVVLLGLALGTMGTLVMLGSFVILIGTSVGTAVEK